MTPADSTQTHRCRAGTETSRCDARGTREELRAHADEVGHARCIAPAFRDKNGVWHPCAVALAWHERQVCDRCAQQVRDDLEAVVVAFGHLERIILQTARRTGGGIPGGDALVYLADGSLQRQPHAYETAEPIRHPLARPDETAPPKIRDEWRNDPNPVLAILEAAERDWRHEFGHGPAVDVATVANCADYLRNWHVLASRTYPGFDDYAATVRELRGRLEHVVGIADDPVTAPIPCACGGRLERRYDNRGLPDTWTCRACGTEYNPDRYVWRLRLLTELPGWVSVERAAATVGRTVSTVWEWVYILDVPSVCSRVTRRTVVELEAVQERAAQARVTRRSA